MGMKEDIYTVLDYQTFCPQGTSAEERKRVNVGDIFANQAKCLNCNEVVRSRNRHDYRSCSCGNLSVDGGSMYCKRSCRDGWETIKEMSELYDGVKE
jgi:hypothetical protein